MAGRLRQAKRGRKTLIRKEELLTQQQSITATQSTPPLPPHKPEKRESYYEKIRRVEDTVRSEKEASNQRLKQQAIEKAYLLYYNKVLFEKGLISEQERNQMIHQINQRHNAAR